MEIVYFNMNTSTGAVSIQESFKPLIKALSEENHRISLLNVPYFGSNPIKMWKNIWFIHKHSTKHGINHITGDIHYGILGLIGRKSVLTIHDDYAMTMARRGWYDKVFKYIFWIYLPIRLADAVVCINEEVRKKISRFYNSKKLQVITHHAVPDGLYPKHKPFNEACPTILQIGTGSNKNLETTLEVLKGLPCKLVVMKQMSPQQEQVAQAYQIDYKNIFNRPFAEVIAAYDASDVVVFPSLFEGLGMPIFEGQAAGKPVITTNREPMNWVAGDGAVLLDDPLDVEEYRSKLLRLIHDADYRNAVVQKGIENAKRFDIRTASAKYVDLYARLLSKA
jgi:glycosyltransferase involved in cell wall biosynthesis